MPFPPAPVPAPPNRQAVTGLIALASVHPDAPDEWPGGVSFVPEPCGAGQLLPIDCEVDTEKANADNPDYVISRPGALAVGNRCTTLDGGRDGEALARRHLLSQQSALLERLLWTGATDATPAEDGTDRQHLASHTVTELPTGGAATDAAQALEVLDQGLTDCLGGQDGMVHMTPRLLAVLVRLQSLTRDGARWLTPNGHTVVAGAGYTGQGPRASEGAALPTAPDLVAVPMANQWMYGTSRVTYLLDAVQVLTDVDRAVNDLRYIAERAGLALFGCCHLGIEVDVTP